MNTQPLISVIVPIYNIMDCLPKCVHSITAQTYSNLEILLVDDGSTDGTGALVDELAKEDERIRVFHKTNGGSSSARNLGLHYATGEYVGFIDSDDYIDVSMYENMMEFMLAKQLQIVQISRDEVNADGTKRLDVCEPPAEPIICDSKTFFKELLLHRGDCSFCTKLINKEVLKDKQFPEGELNEDFRLFIELLQIVDAVGILPNQCYHVFYRIGSNTRKKDANEFSRVFSDIVYNADRVDAMVKHRYPELNTYSIRFGLYQRLDYLLHIPIGQMKNDNLLYRQIVSYLRHHIKDILLNPHLNQQNRVYLILFAIAPKAVRVVHRWKMRLKGQI